MIATADHLTNTPPESPRSVVGSRSDFQIRADFYHKLGLLSPSSSTIESCWSLPFLRPHSELADSSAPKHPQRRPSLGMESSSNDSTSPSSCATKEAPKKRVSFGEQVRVVQIESCRDYPRHIWLQCWDEAHVVREDRKRNALEFRSDGWDWRGVTEEKDFYLAADGKTLVHPATYWSNTRYRRGARRWATRSRSKGLSLEMEPPCGCVPMRMWGQCTCAR